MHSYLRAIGFSTCHSRRQLENIYHTVLSSPNRKTITTVNVDTSLFQMEKDFTDNRIDRMGLSLIGECDLTGNVSVEHYYPYLKGDTTLTFESITLEKQTDKESYAGVCEDSRLGMTLIFYVINIADYAKSKWFNYANRKITRVKFSGLSTEGTIILGISRTKAQRNYENLLRANRDHLLLAANEGDQDAMENLALDEVETFSQICTRVKNEDILSIVDTSFMPCGVECDHYAIVGNITAVHTITNSYSGEEIYNLSLEVNGMNLNVGINSLDLQGEPAVGRRFRGEIWLQGIIQL